MTPKNEVKIVSELYPGEWLDHCSLYINGKAVATGSGEGEFGIANLEENWQSTVEGLQSAGIVFTEDFLAGVAAAFAALREELASRSIYYSER